MHTATRPWLAPVRHVPATVTVPVQVAATLAMLHDPVAAGMVCLLTVLLDVPLAVVARRTRRDPSWVLAGVAFGWAGACSILVPRLAGPAAIGPATAAAVAAVAIGIVLFVVPGRWGHRGAWLAAARRVGVATRRDVAAHVSGRLALVAVGLGSLFLLTAAWLAVLVAAGALISLADDPRSPA